MTKDIDDKEPKQMDDTELLEHLKKKVEAWYAYFKDNIIDGRERKRFAFGDQWEDQVAQEYKATGKVLLTTNKLNPYVRQLVGEVRAFTPALKVKRVDTIANENDQTPKIIENHMRKISIDSDAKTAYQTGFRDQIVSGYGALAAGLEFKDNKSFRQKVTTEEKVHPARVGFDPSAKKLTKWDGDYSFDYESMSKEEFKKTWGFTPEGTGESIFNFTRDDGESFTEDWVTEEKIIVFDFYLKEYFDVDLVELENGETLTRKEYNEMVKTLNEAQENGEAINPSVFDEMKIVQSRKAKDHTVKNYKFISDKILERKKWPSKFLKHVFVDGDSYYDEGKQMMQPFIKDAIDSQRMLNFTNTEIVQNIKDANQEDYVVSPAQIKGFEKQWKDKKRRKGALIANPDKKTGAMPQKQPPSQINPQLHPLSVKFENDIRSCLGLFQSNQGSTEGDISGRAELIRATQGNLSTFVYVSNLTKAMEQLWRVQLDLIKTTVVSTQPLEGVDESGKESAPTVNKPLPFGQVDNDIGAGEFDVEISASSAFSIQKMEELREILSYVAAFPQMQQVIPDIAARKLATDESIDIANRAKGMLPLQIQAQDKTNPQAAMQAQKQLQQQSQMQQMMTQMKVQGEQIKMLAEKQKGQAAQTTSGANMMNAQTNRMTEAGKAQIEAAKLQTEQQKSTIELETERMKLAGQMAQR